MSTVHFYQYRGSDLVANKQLGTPYVTKNGTIKDSINLSHIVMSFNYTEALTHINYCYIAELQRYYFCDSPTITGDIITIPMRLDVRKTYVNFIGDSDVHVVRSESHGNDMLHDDMLTYYPTYQTYSRKFGNGFTRDDKYIITIGG